jgi:hypothetical protein
MGLKFAGRNLWCVINNGILNLSLVLSKVSEQAKIHIIHNFKRLYNKYTKFAPCFLRARISVNYVTWSEIIEAAPPALKIFLFINLFINLLQILTLTRNQNKPSNYLLYKTVKVFLLIVFLIFYLFYLLSTMFYCKGFSLLYLIKFKLLYYW